MELNGLPWISMHFRGFPWSTTDCEGQSGEHVIQYDTTVHVLDDHVHAHNLGIPAIDLMDTSFGEPKRYTFGSYWHTMEDTPDKVSAASLETVGQLVELGLRTDAFVDLNPTPEPLENSASVGVDGAKDDETGTNRSPALALVAFLGLVSIVGLLVLVETMGKR